MSRKLTRSQGAAAVFGGALLGGGGGGDPAWGRALADLAFDCGEVWLTDPRELPPGATVVTAALVGAPGAPEAQVGPQDYWTAFELLRQRCGPVAALLTNENGGVASVNGWYQAARSGLPVLDCPGNGRAHPTGVMGSLNLDLMPGYVSIQACAGGAAPGVRLVVESSLEACARMVRIASVEAGGLVAVARNPAPAGHVLANGAPGAITQAIDLGSAALAVEQPAKRLAAVAQHLGHGSTAVRSTLEGVKLTTQGGFDLGVVALLDESGHSWRLRFWNEYITAEAEGNPVAVFPDLITTLDLTTGDPLTTAAIGHLAAGHPVGLVIAPRAALRLAATMARHDLLAQVAGALGWAALPLPQPCGSCGPGGRNPNE